MPLIWNHVPANFQLTQRERRVKEETNKLSPWQHYLQLQAKVHQTGGMEGRVCVSQPVGGSHITLMMCIC